MFEDPIRPTKRDDTVAKKKPNITIIIEPIGPTGIIGKTAITTAIARIEIPINFILKSFSVRRTECVPKPCDL